MSIEQIMDEYRGRMIKTYAKSCPSTKSHKVLIGVFEMMTWDDAENFLSKARHNKRFVYGSITDDPSYRGYVVKLALDPSDPSIKRRIYDPSAYYPEADEVHEFYLIRHLPE